MKSKVLAVILSLVSPLCKAQILPVKRLKFEELIENYIQDEDQNYENIFENLYAHYSSPVNLNKAGKKLLLQLNLLTSEQIDNLISYRNQNGFLLSIYELQAVPGFDLNTIKKIIPFITVAETLHSNSLFKRIVKEENKYLLIRYSRTVEKKAAFLHQSDHSFQGDPGQLYTKFRCNHPGDFSLGFTLEKDPGESLISPGIPYPDFISSHFQLQNKGDLKNLIIGDFVIQKGQGLVLGGGFSLGKSSEVIQSITKVDRGGIPYTSSTESGYFSGIINEWQFKNFEIMSFYSRKNFDAVLRYDSIKQLTYFTSFIESGLHRNKREIDSRKTVKKTSIGSAITYSNQVNNFQGGITFVHTSLNYPWIKSPTKYNQFDFTGHRNFTAGIFLNYIWKNINLFFEVAQSLSGGKGLITGGILSFSKNLDFSILYRNYEKSFHSFYAQALSEGTRNINENGLYMGFKSSPSKQLTLKCYFDQFTFPWLKFGVSIPSEGYEFLFKGDYEINKGIEISGIYKQENKDKDVSELTSLPAVKISTRKISILQLKYQANRSLIIKTRLQASKNIFNGAKTEGFGQYQQLEFQKGSFKIIYRFMLFDTDDFQNRQYVYENDVLNSFSIPFFKDQGTRNFLLFRYKLNKNLTIWSRLSRTHYRNINLIGSGPNLINGSRKTEFKFQLKYLI